MSTIEAHEDGPFVDDENIPALTEGNLRESISKLLL